MTTVRASDGVALYAEAHGSGPPVLLSCGLCTTHVNFRPQVETLVAAGFRAVLWDYRGHGRSESPDDPEAYTLEQVVNDLGRVLEWAAPGQPAIVASGPHPASPPSWAGSRSAGSPRCTSPSTIRAACVRCC